MHEGKSSGTNRERQHFALARRRLQYFDETDRDTVVPMSQDSSRVRMVGLAAGRSHPTEPCEFERRVCVGSGCGIVSSVLMPLRLTSHALIVADGLRWPLPTSLCCLRWLILLWRTVLGYQGSIPYTGIYTKNQNLYLNLRRAASHGRGQSTLYVGSFSHARCCIRQHIAAMCSDQ